MKNSMIKLKTMWSVGSGQVGYISSGQMGYLGAESPVRNRTVAKKYLPKNLIVNLLIHNF